MINNAEFISVRWENETKNRYYRVIIQRDLFGVLVLLRVWGKIQAAGGGTLVEVLENMDQGVKMLDTISLHRKKRGYNIISSTVDTPNS